jgi:hydroxymethylbilane synthase
MPLRLGTRASALARWQADWVAAQLRQRGIDVLLVPITTTGDRQSGTIGTLGGQGVFTKEIQLALLDGRIDLAVHSLKDLPTAALPQATVHTPCGKGDRHLLCEAPEGPFRQKVPVTFSAGRERLLPQLCLAAVPERAPPGDVLVSAQSESLDKLPFGATVGTGSLRRRAQLLHVRPDLNMQDVRGNIDTRLRKLHGSCPNSCHSENGTVPLDAPTRYDALVLAEAGLRRLGLESHIAQRLPLETVLPAPGQGALALEIRADDEPTRRIVAQLDHPHTHAAVTAERTMLAALQGGCLAPIAALGRVEADRLTLIGRVLSRDGVQRINAAETADLADSLALGRHVAEMLLAQGAAELIQAARQA